MFRFTFKNRQNNSFNPIKQTNVQSKCNNVKNVKNNKLSNFVYSSKKVSFIVKSRKDYWNDIKVKFSLNKDIIDYYILQKIHECYIVEDSDSNLYEEFINQPISPVLALTLILLNKGIFGSQTFNEYLNNDKHQVYAYTHWNGNSFSNNSDKLYIENPFSEDTEEYKQILPGYNNINVMNFYKGYYLYSKNNEYVFSDNKYLGSYNLDLKRFQRIYSNDTKITGSISNFNNIPGNNLLNKYPELDSYLYADGLFKKLEESPYNSKSYNMSTLRGGYGFGPINIACFLKSTDFDKERLTDIIIGLLVAYDSGMTMGDAIKGINEWKCENKHNDLNFLNAESNIFILEYLEYIGSIFLTILLGCQIKDNVLFNSAFNSMLNTTEKNMFNIGNLMSSSIEILNIIVKQEQFKFMKDIEIFSFDIPCIYKNNRETKGTFSMFNYNKNYLDILVDSSPIESLINIKKIIDKEKGLTDYIIPNEGYNIFDFVTKGLNKCLITQIIKNIQEFTNNRKIFVSQSNNFYYEMDEGDITYISPFLSTDLLIAPRKERTFTQKPVKNVNQLYASTTGLDMEVDDTKCRVNFSVVDNTWNSLAQLTDVKYSLPEQSMIIVPRGESTYIYLDDNQSDENFNLQLLVLRYDDYNETEFKNIRIEKGYIFYVNKIKYTVIEDMVLDDLFELLITYAHDENAEEGSTNTRCGYSVRLIRDEDSNKKENPNIHIGTERVFNNLYYPDSTLLTTVDIKNIKVVDEFGNYRLLGIKGLEILYTEKNIITEKTGDKGSNKKVVTNISIVHFNNECYNLPYLNSRILTDRQNTLFKSSYLRSINIQDRILQLFQECKFNINIDSQITKMQNTYKSNDEKYPIHNFLNRFALCILKLCFINILYTSYSLDSLGDIESKTEFYNILSNYFTDFIDISQNYNTNINKIY